MGNAASINAAIEEQYKKLENAAGRADKQLKERPDGRPAATDGLILDQVLRLQSPCADIGTCHPGVLYVIDSELDGRFTLDKLQRFASTAMGLARTYQCDSSAYLVAGHCSLLLWRALQEPASRECVVDWLLTLATQGHRTRHFHAGGSPAAGSEQRARSPGGDSGESSSGSDEPSPAGGWRSPPLRAPSRGAAASPGGCDEGVHCVHKSGLAALHQLLDIERTHDLPLDEFVQWLQAAGKEEGLLNLEDSRQRSYVPLATLRHFAGAVCNGMAGLLGLFFSRAELAAVLDVGGVPAGGGGGGCAGSAGGGGRAMEGSGVGGSCSLKLQLPAPPGGQAVPPLRPRAGSRLQHGGVAA